MNQNTRADGIGFGITHSMVTMMFEASMQAVNPMISLPYWDFTMESAIIDTEHDGDYTKMREITDLWTSEWFGSVDDADFQVRVFVGRGGGGSPLLSQIGTERPLCVLCRLFS